MTINCTISSYLKEDIPKKYHRGIANLLQQYRAEKYPHFEPPFISFFLNLLSLPSPKESVERYALAINQDNQIIGIAYAEWNVEYDNQKRAEIDVIIDKKYRRMGYGRMLLNRIITELPSKIQTISFLVKENSEGELFIRRITGKEEPNFKDRISGVERTSFSIEEVEKEALRLKNKAEDKGYKIEYIEHNSYKKSLGNKYEQFVKLIEELWNDMPKEELSAEEEKLTIERFEDNVQLSDKLGYKILTYVAFDKKSGDPIALTDVLINKYQEWVALQDDTGVKKEHRGNNLGLTLKFQMLNKLLKETKFIYWFTGNASVNKYMININDKLKHKTLQYFHIYEIDRKEMEKRCQQHC